MTLNSTSAVVTDLVVRNREEWKDALGSPRDHPNHFSQGIHF